MDLIKKTIWGPDPKEQIKTINQLLRKNKRELERSMIQLEPIKKKTDSLIRTAVKKNDLKSARIYARERLQIDRQLSKLHTSKARIESITMSINEQWQINKLTHSMLILTVVMKEVNQLINLGMVLGTMQELSKELMRAGIINDMMDDMMSINAQELDEEMEETVTMVIDRIIEGVMLNKLLYAPIVDTAPVVHNPEKTTLDQQKEEVEDMEALNLIRERLNALS